MPTFWLCMCMYYYFIIICDLFIMCIHCKTHYYGMSNPLHLLGDNFSVIPVKLYLPTEETDHGCIEKIRQRLSKTAYWCSYSVSNDYVYVSERWMQLHLFNISLGMALDCNVLLNAFTFTVSVFKIRELWFAQDT